jgi:hypothetical protein
VDSQPSDKYQTEQEHRHENSGHETWLYIVLEVKQEGLSYTVPDTQDPHTLSHEPLLFFRNRHFHLTDFLCKVFTQTSAL